jgi:diguanylate cyclase (GGDEF)-like protein
MQGKEKRAFERYPADLAAELASDGGEVWQCRILDFCAEGMLLESSGRRPFQQTGSAGGIRLQQPLRLQFMLGKAASAQRVTLAGRVVRVNGWKAGVALERLAPPLIQLLLEHSEEVAARQKQAGAGPKRPDLPAEQAAALRGAIEAAAERHFAAIHREILREYEKELITRAATAATGKESAACERDLAQFELGRGDLLAALSSRTSELVEALGVGGSGAQRAAPGVKRELTLMDEGDLESWLAVSDLVHTLDKQVGTALADVQREHCRFVGKDAAIPFSPDAIGGLLHDLPDQPRVGSDSRSQFLKAAGRVLIARLAPFYEDLAANLKQLADQAAAQRAASPLPAFAAESAGAGPSVVASTDVLQALAVLQRQFEAGHAWPRHGAIRERLSQLLAPQGRDAGERALDAQVEERLGLAERLLDSILEDPTVAGTASSWLERLQLILFEAAVDQPSFHREGTHPVARIASQLEHLGMLVGRGSEARDVATRERIDKLIAGLLSRGLPETQELQRVSKVLSVMESRESADYQQNVARLVAACEGEARIRTAQDEVHEELSRRFVGRPLPTLLVDLINGGWAALLQLTHIRKGPSSAEWATRWKTLEDLEALLLAPRGRSGTGPPEPRTVLEAIEEGLAYAAFDPFQRAQLSRSLSRRLIEGVDVDTPEQAAQTELNLAGLRDRRRVEQAAADDVARPPAGLGPSAWQSLLDRVAQLRPGAALVVRGPDGVRQVRSIAWIDEERRRHVLVDNRGLKAETWSAPEIARRLHAGTLSIEDPAGASLVDRAAETVLHEMEERLSADAWHEPMTGLYNRRYLINAIRKAIRSTRAGDRRPALVMVDLDQFKLINDAYGIEAGDEVLRALGAMLRDHFEPPAIVAHLGADEFAVLLDDAEVASLLAAAEVLRGRIQQIPVAWKKSHLRVEASIGVAFVYPYHEEPGQILSAVEAACAAAKEAGRNQVAVYREDDNLVARRKSWMQSIVQLHEALDSDRIRLRCQRIAPLFPDGEKRGHYEVLLGVVGPDGADVPLGPFISAAENFNRMGIVDQAVVRKTLAWMTQHPALLESVGGFAINLSGDSLNDPQLVDFIAQAFKDTGADPTKVCFEVTESLAIASLDRATEMIHRIKNLGCRFALDDFGSGMASYSYLKKLPVDRVKIDGTFIKDLAHSESDFAVVKSINEISHFLGKETIAEYVENEAIAERLRRIGVDYAQGYGIERPRYLTDLAKDLEAVGPVREAVAQALPDAGNDATVPSPPQERPAA